jgi:S-adenosylhomocysteine hydrolase
MPHDATFCYRKVVKPLSRPAQICTAELLNKLHTAEGQALLSKLVDQLAPHTQVSGLLEPTEQRSSPSDRFEAKILTGVFRQFVRQSDVREAAVVAVGHEFQAILHDHKVLDSTTVQQALGPKGLQFFEALRGISGNSGDPLADRRTFEGFGRDAADIAKHQSIAPKMAAMDIMLKQVAKKNEFAGFSFMGLQHLFASSATMFDGVHSLGVKHEDMRLIGKVYSTNHRVVAELASKGVEVDGVSMRVGPQAFGNAMRDSIDWQLRRIIDTLPRACIFDAEGAHFAEPPTPRVLLIDDGAEAIQLLHEKYPEYAPFFVCVEQTRRGSRILHEMEAAGTLKCAVANVAETWAKLEWESPMIGHSVVLEVSRKLDRLERSGVPAPKESLVLGCGAVGGGVARAMVRRGLDIHLYDKDDSRSHALKAAMLAEGLPAAQIHVHTDKQEALQHAEVLVSCVGARTLDEDDHVHLPDGAILVNAASADDELGPKDLMPFEKSTNFDDRGNLWSTFRGHAINTGKADADAHSDAVLAHPSGKEFLLVNHGYVVNMTGERDPIPARYIQLTRTLLLLGAITATRAAKGTGGTERKGAGAGLHDVPHEWQQALVNLVQRELKRTGEDLQHPSWEQQPADAHAPEEQLSPPPTMAQAKRVGGVVGEDKEIDGQAHEGKGPAGALSLYGLRLGATASGSLERTVVELVDGGRELSIEGAALYKATIAINAHMGVHLRTSLKDLHGAPSLLFTDNSRVEFLPGRKFTSVEESSKAHFEHLVGHFSRVLIGSLLSSRLKRPATMAEVGDALRPLLAKHSVDVGGWQRQLQQSTDAEDQQLAKALQLGR